MRCAKIVNILGLQRLNTDFAAELESLVSVTTLNSALAYRDFTFPKPLAHNIRTCTVITMANFHDLPTELRYVVYDYLWLATPNIRLVPEKHRSIDLFAKYPSNYGRNDYTFGLPIWRHTNKLLLREGLDHFNSTGRLQLGLNRGRAFGMTEEYYDATLFPALLPPYAIRNLVLELMPNEKQPVGVEDTFGRLMQCDEAYCVHLLTEAAEAGRLQTLIIKFFDVNAFGIRQKMPSDADFSALTTILEPVADQMKRIELSMPYLAPPTTEVERDAVKQLMIEEWQQLRSSISAGTEGNLRIIHGHSPSTRWSLVWKRK
jgi:hypothetical protein